MKKFRKHAIECVATMITDMLESFEESVRYVKGVNDGEGFVIDYVSKGLPKGHWLRVEGVHLSAKDMAKAISIAEKEMLRA